MSGLLECIRRHSCLPHNSQVRLMDRVAVRHLAVRAQPDSLAFLYRELFRVPLAGPPSLLEPALMDSMKLTHLYEKFMVAVDLLATSPGSLQRRLEGAYKSLIDVEPRDFDDREMRTTLKQILSRITRIQDEQVGSIAATCRQMSDQEAAEAADFIFSLFLRIAEQYQSSP
jgi:hypothetical protein